MFKTLYARLVFTLFVLFALMGAMFVVASMYSAHMYQQEVSQHLNRNLAMYIANERVLIDKGRINQKNLENLFQQAMIINPSLELYLLDPNGKIISYSSHLHGVVRDHVSLQAIKHFFSTSPDTLVEGDDPKSRFGRKAFSVAAINNNGKLQGYIYAILGSEQYDHVTEMLKQSYIMQWSVSTIIVSLVFAFVAYLSRAYRWRLLIEPLGYTPKLSNSFYALMIGYLANFAFPRACGYNPSVKSKSKGPPQRTGIWQGKQFSQKGQR